MDLNILQELLRNALAQFHQGQQVRYHNIGFSSKDLRDLDDVTQTLRGLLPNYIHWEGPGIMQAPIGTITRSDFAHSILSAPGDGLIIQQPEQWLSHWQLTDKQAFWSDLGMWHGTKKVVLVFAASDEFQQINNAYFKPQLLGGVPIKLWRPARAE
jgi:hypothetical protein